MVFVMTRKGQGIKIRLNSVKTNPKEWEEEGGLVSDEKKLIRLMKGDKIASVVYYNDKKTTEIFYITMKGWGSRFLLSDIRAMGAGGAGVKCAKLTAKTGEISEVMGVSKSKKVTALTGHDLEFSFNTKEVPILKRGSTGTWLICLKEKDWIEDLEY